METPPTTKQRQDVPKIMATLVLICSMELRLDTASPHERTMCKGRAGEERERQRKRVKASERDLSHHDFMMLIVCHLICSLFLQLSTPIKRKSQKAFLFLLVLGSYQQE